MLLASENQPDWKLSEGFSVEIHMYKWCGRIRPGETGFKYCTVPYQRRKREKQQIFQLRPRCFTETLLSSALLNLLEGITRDCTFLCLGLGKGKLGPCVYGGTRRKEKSGGEFSGAAE